MPGGGEAVLPSAEQTDERAGEQPGRDDAKRARMDEAGAADGAAAAAAAEPAASAPGVPPATAPEPEDERFGTEETGYEYLDHTADVQIHSWGRTLEESFEQAVTAMFGYMTDLTKVDEAVEHTQEFEVEGHDMLSLLFNLLDEFLFRFVADPYVVCSRIKIVEFDKEAFKIRVKGFGEVFDLDKHSQGTEIKAITYSNMQIHHEKPRKDVYVIVDI